MDIKKLLQELTIEEKVSLLAGKDMWTLNGVERLGIPSVCVTDGPHGVRLSPGSEFDKTLPATSMPVEAAMAATFNPELIEQLGAACGAEAQHYNVGVLLGPGANGKRSPLGGRNFEYFSEDPQLSGEMAAAFINGLQSQGVGASLKHFAVNDQETRRMTINCELDDRALHEIYLRPFEIAITRAKPWTVMGAYNKVRGTHACQNSFLLEQVLRNEYGFDGVVVTDWTACIEKVPSHRSGLDLEMPGPGYRDKEMIEAVENGSFPMEILDRRVGNILKLIKKVVENRKETGVDWPRHHQLAKEAVCESSVLLENRDNILPLRPGISAAVLGEMAKVPRYQGGGSSHMNPQKLDIPFDEIARYCDAVYAPGYTGESADEPLLREAEDAVRGKDAVIIYVGTTELIESEGYDRKNIRLPAGHTELIRRTAAVNPNIIVVNSSGSAMDFREILPGCKGLLHIWLPGEAGGSAVADMLFGKASPGGRLSETFPVCLENTPAYESFGGFKDQTVYSESLMVGYRYYDTKQIPVQYPFGYGLSYTTFSMDNLRLSATETRPGETLTVQVDVTNTGDRAGQETVQLYVHDDESYLFRPARELKGFAKVALEPGECKTVSIELDDRAFSYFVPHLNRFAVEEGTFIISVGSSVAQIVEEASVLVRSADNVKLPLQENDPIQEFLETPEYSENTRAILKTFGIDENHLLWPVIVGMPLLKLTFMLGMMGVPKELTGRISDCIVAGQPLPQELTEYLNSSQS